MARLRVHMEVDFLDNHEFEYSLKISVYASVCGQQLLAFPLSSNTPGFFFQALQALLISPFHSKYLFSFPSTVHQLSVDP